MREFTSLSGPWAGLSMQEGFRIGEKIMLRIYERYIRGDGEDSDGVFIVDGSYDPITNDVRLVRRYIRCNREGSAVGYPFVYEGKWDGMMVSGKWHMSTYPNEGDAFEMWPESEEDLKELQIKIEEIGLVLTGPTP